MASKKNEESTLRAVGTFLFKRLVSAFMCFILILTAIGVFFSPKEYIGHAGGFWLNSDHVEQLSLHDQARVEGLIQKGVIHTREDFVNAITGFYSTIISTLIAFVGFFAILQFTFIINQAREASKKATEEHLDSRWPELEDKLQEQAKNEASEFVAEEYRGKLEQLEAKVAEVETRNEQLEKALQSYTKDPEPPEEDECESEVDIDFDDDDPGIDKDSKDEKDYKSDIGNDSDDEKR